MAIGERGLPRRRERGTTADARRAQGNSGRRLHENLAQIGGYQYVVPTEILRPLRDRTLYCLFYATRHESGIAAFRECQIKALMHRRRRVQR